ncbi:helix-turn-helix domain-containing protein [Brucella intermedia]|uniref:helix-turn-helix domain-containing protein n=1 Tax=Brucella intermedia TaxID=94625 RepID=UPI00178C2B29|nr:AraC family transcriptional regulator [Brucella intermedia]
MTALRTTPLITGQGVWDQLQTTLVGDSYLLVDDAFALCNLSVRLFQPFVSTIVRRDFITLQYLQRSGTYFHHLNGRAHKITSGSVTMTVAESSVTEIRSLRSNAAVQPSRAVSMHIARDHLVQSFGLRPELWREDYRTAFFNGRDSTLSISVQLTSEMWGVLDSLIDCHLDEPIRTAYMRIKAMELLLLTVVELNNYDGPKGHSALVPDARDKKLIDVAAHIYRRELAKPPSIEELARRTGLNRNKLTAGFRAAFGVTPAEYSRSVRLEWAAEKLFQGATIAQAAAEAGYDSVPAFGRAFRQHFGRVPSDKIIREQGIPLQNRFSRSSGWNEIRNI